MSTDYDAVCDVCKESIHLGQRIGGKYSFGYGSKDMDGAGLVARWLMEHIDLGHNPRIEVSGSMDPRPSDEYVRIEHEQIPIALEATEERYWDEKEKQHRELK